MRHLVRPVRGLFLGLMVLALGRSAMGQIYGPLPYGAKATSGVSRWSWSNHALYGPPSYGCRLGYGMLTLGSGYIGGSPVTLEPISAPPNNSQLAFVLSGTGNANTAIRCDGTLALSTVNTYAGSTAVSGGTLRLPDTISYPGYLQNVIGNTGALCLNGGTLQTATGGITVSAGTLVLSNSNTFSGGTLLVTSSGVIADGTSLFVGDAALLSPLVPVYPAAVVTGGSSGTLELNSTSTIAGGPSLTVSNGTDVFSVRTPAPTVVRDLSLVPEPSTLALLAIAAGSLLALRLRTFA